MTRFDRRLFILGPLLILVLWMALPGGLPEGSRKQRDVPAHSVVVELVGYALDASHGRPRLVGRDPEAGFRLHQAAVSLRAGWLLPPTGERSRWRILPARAGLTLRRLVDPRRSVDLSATNGEDIRETSLRPWARAEEDLQGRAVDIGCRDPIATLTPVRLRRIRVRDPKLGGSTEPEVLWLETAETSATAARRGGQQVISCPQGKVWWRSLSASASDDPCAAGSTGWSRARMCGIGKPVVCIDPWTRAWGARVAAGGTESQLLLPWSKIVRERIGFSMSGLGLASIRLGIDASAFDLSPLPICPAGSGRPVEVLGPLELRSGDLLAIGRTRFLVRTPRGLLAPLRGDAAEGGSREVTSHRRLELFHVRNPRAPGYFRASSGHDVYHPNRRALWTVPACGSEEEMLTLAVKPRGGDDETREGGAAALPQSDRRRRRRITAAARDHGVPHELPAVVPDRVRDRALLSLCAAHEPGREIIVHLVPDSSRGIRLRMSEDGVDAWLDRRPLAVPIGSSREPRELLVDLDGNLLRIAPAAGVRVTRNLRFGLAVYLALVLALQAAPLTLARIARRRMLIQRPEWAREAAWPADLGTPTLQQLAGIAVACLLFLGASFQLYLALHPGLAGKPDYIQAFLQGVVVVCAVLAAAAGFAFGNGLPQRAANASLGAALAVLAAAGWWWWDSGQVPDALWLSAWRNQAVAAAGASPAGTGKLLLGGSGLLLAAAAMLRLSGWLRWPTAAERAARFTLRLPSAGFLVIAVAGLGLGILQRSALAFELAILGGLAWVAAVYWSFVRHQRLYREDRLRHRAAVLSMASGVLMLLFLVAFFVVGSSLPDRVSFLLVALGLAILGRALAIIIREQFTSLLRVLSLWLVASVVGMGFASVVLTDMGSVAAWLPALLTGFFLWLVRPEESESRLEEPRKAVVHLLLAVGSGLVLLGLLDVFRKIVLGLGWGILERPRQRLTLAEDVSYITPGEWITQVRWLASHHEGDLQWVPNVNSDVAIFGLAANFGSLYAVCASLILLAVAGCAGLAADQALREARATTAVGGGDRLYPALHRTLGLFLGMVCVLLIAQWLVHLATGVVLHLPITGLVFPWLSHGNTTHLLYAAAVLLPMAAITALAGGGSPAVRQHPVRPSGAPR